MPFPNEDTQFKAGESGNPNGYSRGRRLSDALLKHFDSKVLDGKFIEIGVDAALKGDFNFWRYVFDRIDGKIPDDQPQPEASMETLVAKVRERKGKRKGK